MIAESPEARPAPTRPTRSGLVASWALVSASALLACALAVSCGGSDNGGSGGGTGGGTAGGTAGGTGGGTAAAAINGCTTFADHTAAGDARTITFTFPAYTPPCIHISPGQSVTFSGAFASHPLRAGVAPSSTGTSTASTPITSTDSGSSQTFVFSSAGTFGYYCNFHQGDGMFGAILVQ